MRASCLKSFKAMEAKALIRACPRAQARAQAKQTGEQMPLQQAISERNSISVDGITQSAVQEAQNYSSNPNIQALTSQLSTDDQTLSSGQADGQGGEITHQMKSILSELQQETGDSSFGQDADALATRQGLSSAIHEQLDQNGGGQMMPQGMYGGGGYGAAMGGQQQMAGGIEGQYSPGMSGETQLSGLGSQGYGQTGIVGEVMPGQGYGLSTGGYAGASLNGGQLYDLGEGMGEEDYDGMESSEPALENTGVSTMTGSEGLPGTYGMNSQSYYG